MLLVRLLPLEQYRTMPWTSFEFTVLLVSVLSLENPKKMPSLLFEAVLFVSVLLVEEPKMMPQRLFNTLLSEILQ